MKNKINMAVFFAFISVMLLFACEPMTDVRPDIEPAPTVEDLDIKIEAGSDPFHVIVSDNSAITGNARWDFGNGLKTAGQSVEVGYPLEGNYTITLTLVTNGGFASKSIVHTQETSDQNSILVKNIINISGGLGYPDGKVWVIDSLTTGHLGVGDANSPGGIGIDWWQAGPLEKTGRFIYDDFLNFQFNDYNVTYTNHGKSFVKDYVIPNPAYTVLIEEGGDRIVSYPAATNGAPGKWNIYETDGKYFLTMTGDTPIFPFFDVGGSVGDGYEIISSTENTLELTCISGLATWGKWHFLLIAEN